MKKLKIFKIIFLVMALMLTFVIHQEAWAARGSSKEAKNVAVTTTFELVDNAQILQANEKAELLKQIKAVEQKHGVKLMLYTAPSIKGGVARDYARTVVDKKITNQKALICVITMEDRQWYLAANKSMKEYAVTQDYGIDYLSEDMVPLLKEGKYAQAFSTYISKADELLTFAKENGHPHTDKDDFSIGGFLVSLGIAGFIGFCFRAYLIALMSNVAPATEASGYLVQDSFKLEHEKDTYLYTNTTVVPRSSSSSSGGSDGGSGGSGGGGSF